MNGIEGISRESRKVIEKQCKQKTEIEAKASKQPDHHGRRVTEGSKEQLPGTKLRAWDGSLAGHLQTSRQ